MRRIRRLALVPVVAALLVVGLWSLPAAAVNQPGEWSQGNYVGDCGVKSGGYVWSVQSILWSDGLLSSSQVDGLWGPITKSASKSWQSRHGLGVDGCWGPNTWYKAQHGYHNINVGGEVIRYYHMTTVSLGQPYSRYRYEERGAGRRVTYLWWGTPQCWTVDPPGARGSTAVSTESTC
jgi:peptidoglycan hydrolase-like protein with peptidoglycan-binding domain